MTRGDAARVLLVRAVEESEPSALSADDQVDALVAAGSLQDEGAWLTRRASHLLRGPLARYRELLALPEGVGLRWLWILLPSLLLGALTNYLGPSQRIHVLYNPIVLLVGWNLAVYAWLLGRRAAPRLWRRGDASPAPRPAAAPPVSDASDDGEPAPAPELANTARAGPDGLLARWLMRRVLPGLWLRLHRAASSSREHGRSLARIARTFWQHWFDAARPQLLIGARRMVHAAAVAVALGAVAGMFVRGLVLDYNVVWRSTFVRDPAAVADLLQAFVWLPALIVQAPDTSREAATRLMGETGVLADDWMWLYAALVVLAVAVPRALLYAAASLRLRSRFGQVTLDLDDAYFRALIERARVVHVEELKQRIGSDVKIECAKFAEGVSVFVANHLYDERLAPQVEAFRTSGGRIADLEAALHRECEAFRTPLEQHLPQAQRDFEEGLSRSIQRTLGAALAVEAAPREDVRGRLGSLSDASGESLAASLGASLSQVVGSAVSAAAALVAGTVSGGFGHSLGTALLVGLLGTTGPIGFLIGALGGLVLAAGTFWTGRRYLEGSLRRMHLPGPALRAVLWPGRLRRLLDDGRARCRQQVKDLLQAELEPLVDTIAEQVWAKVRPLIGAQLQADPTRPQGD